MVLDMRFDTTPPSRVSEELSKLYEARYEVLLLPKHCYPSLPLVPEPPITRCRKVRNVLEMQKFVWKFILKSDITFMITCV